LGLEGKRKQMSQK